MARELLKRGASVDLPSSTGFTALIEAAIHGHTSIVLVLLQHSANPDLQDVYGATALMMAAQQGHEACVQALLRAGANTELRTKKGNTALQLAEAKGHTATAKLIRQHASCLSLGLGLALCARVPLAWPWVVLSVVLGAIATVAFSRTLTAGSGRHRAARQLRPHRPARHAKAHGRTTTAETTRQHAALLQPAATMTPHAMQAAQAARVDAAIEEPPAEESAEQVKGQPPSNKSKKKEKADRAAATGDEPSEAPPTAALPPLPAATSKLAVSAAERALRAVTAGGGLSALKVALAAAPREVREGGVGAKARDRRDRLLEAQQEAECEAKQGAAAETARLTAAVRVAAAALAAARKAAAAAAAKADALERTAADGGEGGGRGAAGPSEASEAEEVPDEYICPITAEIMTDPVTTVDGFTYERTAISEWLRTKDTSPFTGATLESKTVIPNLSLRSIIRGFSEASAARCTRRVP
eukprot:scaffold15656_cov69-Phaeocystis_antarctica.AAC.1